MNWIGIELKDFELELNWLILNPTWIGIELNWKKWIDPSPVFNIGEFKSITKNSTTIKHIYKESAYTIEGCNFVFDTKDLWNFP